MQRQREIELSGKVAIVTGASRGIGKRAALALARRGVKVVVVARTVDPDSKLPGTVGQTVTEIESLGGEGLAVATDLAEEEDLNRLVDATMDRFGGVDILINNAAVTQGYNWSAPLLEMPRADWLHHFAVNVHAPFTLVQLVLPSMEARGGGRILNVTTASAEAARLPEELPFLVGAERESRNVRTPPDPALRAGEPSAGDDIDLPGLESPGYFSSKRALDRFAHVIAPQLRRKNVFIISLHPGHVATEIAVARQNGDDSMSSILNSMDVPARMLVYFAGCENPAEYTGRIFIADRDLKELGLEPAGV